MLGVDELTAVTFSIPGKPFAKQRPRFSRRNGRAFTPKQTVSFEQTVGTIAAQHIKDPLQGPVEVTIHATFEMPKSWSAKKKDRMRGRPHIQRPDLDNVEKAILDGLNRIAFADDEQGWNVVKTKAWGDAGVTHVTLVGADA